MKLFTGWVMLAGLLGTAGAADAQILAPSAGSPYTAVSDFDGPYAAMPPAVPAPRYGPSLLPPREVYTVVRESGFSPLGIPQLRGLVYTIAVIDRGGDDGRLVIDARTGRIIRFISAYQQMGGRSNDTLRGSYGPVGPRPPKSIPHVASRTPVPKPSPLAAKPAAAPAQQAAAVQAKPAEVPATPPAVTTGAVPVKPAPQIAPTQEMPSAQGLE